MQRLVIAMAFIAVTALTTAVFATQTKKPVTHTKSVTAQATIEAIDAPNRIITLKGPKGNLVEVYATDKVTRFAALKVGDVVTATYSESIAMTLRKPGEAAPPKNMKGVNMRPDKPGAMATHEKTVTVSVESVDKSVPSLTVKASDGKIHSFVVLDPKNLEGVNVGDKIDVTYTQGLLVKADPPKK
jgi:hypothetical protein